MLVIAALIPIFVTTSITIRKGFIEINHLSTFLFGYIFYWIFPIISGSLNLFENETLMDKWYSSFGRIEYETKITYILLCFSCWLSFVTGSYMGSNSKISDNKKIRNLLSNPETLNEIKLRILLNVTLIFGILGAYQIRDSLFVGYSVENIVDPNQAKDGVGTVVGLTSILFTIFLMKVFFSKKLSNENDTRVGAIVKGHFDIKKDFSSIYAIAYLFFATLIVSTGSRLYFLSNICALSIYATTFCFRLDIRKFMFSSSLLLSIFTVYGTTRLGLEYKISLENILFSFFGETIYTSFSLVSFLESYKINFFQFPFLLISDMVNLLPSFIFPDKNIINYKDIYNLDSPLGAFHSFPSFLLNFGVVGTILCLFAFGFFMGNIKKYADSNKMFRLVYVLISSNMAFTLFRDPFSISIIKNIFEFSIVLPVAFCMFTFGRKHNEKQV